MLGRPLNDAEASRSEAAYGGYARGYEESSCFWGREPGSLVRAYAATRDVSGLQVLDAGAGEGKNAAHLTRLGAQVTAVELAASAVANGRTAFGESERLRWIIGDVLEQPLKPHEYDLVIAYGLFHCLRARPEVERCVVALQTATKPAGAHIVCVFNDRNQDLTAHPGFSPCLLAHEDYLAMYEGWDLQTASDRDLTETHPHNGIEHTHSMTRFIATRLT